MGIKLKPKQAVATPPRAATTDPIGAAIDRLVSMLPEAEKIAKKVKDLQKEMAAFGEAEKELLALIKDDFRYNDTGPDEGYRISGTLGYVDVGKKGTKREIVDMPALRLILKDSTFMKLAKINLKDVDQYLTPKEKVVCIEETRTDRGIKVEAKAKITA